MQYSQDDPIPIDFRDFVSLVAKENQLDEYFGEFAPAVTARLAAHTFHQARLTRGLFFGPFPSRACIGRTLKPAILRVFFRLAFRGQFTSGVLK